MVKTKVNQDICIGCGACTAIAPDLYELDKNCRAKAKKSGELTKEEIKKATEAADTCPVQAIDVK